MEFRDVIIHTNARIFGNEQLMKGFPPIRDRFDLTSDMWIGRLDLELAKTVMDTCEPQVLGMPRPARQFAQLYSFIRDLPYEDMLNFDSDQMLAATVALSRLVHPTSTGLTYAARVGFEGSKARKIFTAEVSGISKDAFLSPSRTRDWLTVDDAKILVSLLPHLTTQLPRRLHNAFWHHEYAARTYYLDYRWTLVCTGLEALLHTDRFKNTAQFVRRVPQVAAEFGISISDAEADEAYDLRSRLSHGDSFLSTAASQGPQAAAQLKLYDRIEDTLRCAVLQGMRDQAFADVFRDDGKIRKRWPI